MIEIWFGNVPTTPYMSEGPKTTFLNNHRALIRGPPLEVDLQYFIKDLNTNHPSPNECVRSQRHMLLISYFAARHQ